MKEDTKEFSSVAVGTAVARCPRTGPCLRRYRKRFLPWMCRPRAAVVKARIRVFMNNVWNG